MPTEATAIQTGEKSMPARNKRRAADADPAVAACRPSLETRSARWKLLWQASDDIADTATALGMLVDTPFYFDEDMLAALTTQLVARLSEQNTLSDSLSCEKVGARQEARELIARKKHFGYTKEVEAWYEAHSATERSVRNDARQLLVSAERRARILVALGLGDLSLGVKVCVPW